MTSLSLGLSIASSRGGGLTGPALLAYETVRDASHDYSAPGGYNATGPILTSTITNAFFPTHDFSANALT